MKIGLFTDPHYCKAEILCRTRRPSLSLSKVKEAMETFRKEGVELCICLGDLVDKCDSLEESYMCLDEMIGMIRSYKIPFLLVPGNHDYTVFSAEELSERTGCRIPPYTVDMETHRLVILDANYRSDFRRFDIAGVDWTDSNLPPEQMEYLNDALNNSSKPCIVLIHENLDNTVESRHIVKNAPQIRDIIEKSKTVTMVIQGHYHNGADHTINGIRYLTLPAMCEEMTNKYCIIDTKDMSILSDS